MQMMSKNKNKKIKTKFKSTLMSEFHKKIQNKRIKPTYSPNHGFLKNDESDEQFEPLRESQENKIRQYGYDMGLANRDPSTDKEEHTPDLAISTQNPIEEEMTAEEEQLSGDDDHHNEFKADDYTHQVQGRTIVLVIYRHLFISLYIYKHSMHVVIIL